MSDGGDNGASGLGEAEALDRDLEAVGRHRDRTAFARLFTHFAPRLKAYLARSGSDAAMADELAQEVMVLVWRRAETYDRRQASAATWIFTIARNRRIDAFRRERRPEAGEEELAQLPDPERPADERLHWAQQGRRLRAALATLPVEQREVLLMAYYQDKPHSQIAAERNLPLGTVKSRLRLAHQRLRKLFEDRT